MFLSLKERETAWAGGGWWQRERGGQRIWSRLQAPSCQHTAQCRARTHEPWDHNLNPSRMLNWLSHPGAPHHHFLLQSHCFDNLYLNWLLWVDSLRWHMNTHSSHWHATTKLHCVVSHFWGNPTFIVMYPSFLHAIYTRLPNPVNTTSTVL